MKLITLGCSLTQVCGIPEYLGKAINLEVIDLSESAGSNMLQIKRLHDSIAQNKVCKDDIAVWQITSDERAYESLPETRLNEVTLLDKSKQIPLKSRNGELFQPYHHVLSSKNIFNSKRRIDLLCNSKLLNKTHSVEDDLQMFISTLVLAKNFFRKLFVYFGWDDVMDDKYKTIFLNCIDYHDINFINQSFLDWAIENKKEMGDDEAHPSCKTGKEFAETFIQPLVLAEIFPLENEINTST